MDLSGGILGGYKARGLSQDNSLKPPEAFLDFQGYGFVFEEASRPKAFPA